MEKNETFLLKLDNLMCNSNVGNVAIAVDCRVLMVTETGCSAVTQSCSVGLMKIPGPVILSFTAKRIESNALTADSNGFTTLEQLLVLPSVPVNVRPYASPDPPSPTPPTPVKKQKVIVSWKTTNAFYLTLSEGGQLSCDEGTEIIMVSQSLTEIELTAYSPKRIFCQKKLTLIT